MTTTPEVLAAMCHAVARHEGVYPLSAKRDTTYLNYQGHVEAALAAAEALGWVLVPKKEAERLNEIRRMVEHCRKMEGDDQLQCFMESAVTAFNDRDMLEAEVRALRAASPKVGEP